MVSNILDPAALIALLPTLLPSSKQTLSSSQDGIAALLHAAMTALAFRLIAVDESSLGTSPLTVLPDGWNKDGPSHYTFRYRHDQSSLEFVLKVSKLGGRTLVNAIALESDKASSLDIPTNDFVSPSFYPHDLSASDTTPLIHGFISSNRVTDLMSQFKLKIISKLVPGLRKDGYTETEDVSTSSNVASAVNPNPAPAQPRGPPPVRGEHPYEIPSRSPLEIGRNPLEIGRRDLEPFPGMPANPFSPPPLFPGAGGDGMFVGPGHPIFGGGQRGPRSDRGPWGGDGFLPPMGAPPGARFDPIVPGMGPFPPSGPGRGRGPPRGEPDNDEFMPPGMNDMFM